MLVLSRKRNETINIGDDVSITVVDLTDYKVRLGIEAPADVTVHRAEVYRAIMRQTGGARARAPSFPQARVAGPTTLVLEFNNTDHLLAAVARRRTTFLRPHTTTLPGGDADGSTGAGAGTE